MYSGERCEFNFGSRPFAYPTEDYHPLIKPPPYCAGAAYLLGCFRALTAAQLAYKRSCTRGTWVRSPVLMYIACIENQWRQVTLNISISCS